jgi:hypothetical protein
MIIDIGQKVLKVELNFKIPHGDVINLEVSQEGKTYKKQIPKPSKAPKVTIISKGKKIALEWKLAFS